MQGRWVVLAGIAATLCAAGIMLLPGCGDKKPLEPEEPLQPTIDCPSNPFDMISVGLLSTPVMSPGDGYIYYYDSAVDSAYYDAWLEYLDVEPWLAEGMEAGIYRINPNDSSPAEFVIGRATEPEVSPDGKWLYFGHHDGTTNGIWRIRLPHGRPELVKEGRFTSIKWFAEDTLVVNRAYDWPESVYLLDIRNDSLHPLPMIRGDFDVAPDRRICFSHYDPVERKYSIKIYDLLMDTTWRINFRHLEEATQLCWSPDGKKILCMGWNIGNTRRDIWTIDLHGVERRFPGWLSDEPSYTPDGNNIVFIRWPYSNCFQHQATQIWMMSAKEGSGLRQVTTWDRIRP